jgi:hypothetical protein
MLWNRVASGRAPLAVQDAVDAPAAVGRQNIPLSSQGVAHQKEGIANRWCDIRRSGRRTKALRPGALAHDQGASKRKGGYGQCSQSPGVSLLPIQCVFHAFFFRF